MFYNLRFEKEAAVFGAFSSLLTYLYLLPGCLQKEWEPVKEGFIHRKHFLKGNLFL